MIGHEGIKMLVVGLAVMTPIWAGFVVIYFLIRGIIKNWIQRQREEKEIEDWMNESADN